MNNVCGNRKLGCLKHASASRDPHRHQEIRPLEINRMYLLLLFSTNIVSKFTNIGNILIYAISNFTKGQNFGKQFDNFLETSGSRLEIHSALHNIKLGATSLSN